MHHENPSLKVKGMRSTPSNLRRLERAMRIRKGKRPKHMGSKAKNQFARPVMKGMELFLQHFNNGQKQTTIVGTSKKDKFGREHYLGHDRSVVSKELHARGRTERKAVEFSVIKNIIRKARGRS